MHSCIQDGGAVLQYVIVAATYECSAACVYCRQAEARDAYPRGSAGATEAILAGISELTDEASIHITGGDPFLCRHIGEILSVAHGVGATLSLACDVRQLDRLLEMSPDDWPTRLFVSVDSLDPQVFASTRGLSSGHLRYPLQRIRKVVDDGGLDVELVANTVVSDRTCAALSVIEESLLSVGFDRVVVSHLQWGDHDLESFNVSCNGGTAARRVALRVDYDALWRGLSRLSESAGIVPPMTRQELRRYYRDPHFRLSSQCSWPKHGCYICPDASIYTCGASRIGSLRTQTMRDVWSSDAARRIRSAYERELTQECRQCCHMLYQRGCVGHLRRDAL